MLTSDIPRRELKLHSPAGVEPAVFTWPNIEQQKANKDAVFIGGDEIVRTMRLVFEDYPELYQQNVNIDDCDIHSYPKMKELCDKFNKIIDTHVKLNRGTEAFSVRLEQRATAKLFRHVLAQVYSRAVTDPDKLRAYQPFSPSVYGETSPDLIDSILKVIQLTEDQTFIDLGSGVGNVVLHVAALANCKHVYGIEHEDTPAKYAGAMGDEFRFWMRWYGKHYSEFELERGDFLTHAQIDERIKEADVIFANNYVFGSTVNHELKVKFMNMKDGAKIVSSREFCPETFRLNDRTRNDLGAVMHVTKPEEFFGKVSWSDKSVQYYMHVIDHSKLAHYYEKAHQQHARTPKSTHSKAHDDDHSSSSNQSSSSSSLPSKKNGLAKSGKVDENRPPSSQAKRKRKSLTPRTAPSGSPSTVVTARGRKVHAKHASDHQSDYSSDGSSGELLHPKQRRTAQKDYQSTLNDLHTASEKFVRSNQHAQIKNDRFNHQNMTKLSTDNLQFSHLRDCLVEQEDQRFIRSVNSHLEQFRQRLFAYFTYMKSDVYREHLRKQLDNEMELNQTLKAKVNCLESNIKALLEDAIRLLKLRTNELGVDELERPVQLISYANDISSKHKELRSKVASLEKEIAEYDHENEKINALLNDIPTGSHASSSSKSLANGNVYSTLLMNMSEQTQQGNHKPDTWNVIHSMAMPISPNASIGNRFDFDGRPRPNAGSSYSVVKAEQKTDFIIQKRPKRTSDPNASTPTIVSPIKIIKVAEKRPDLPDSLPLPASLTSAVASSFNNLLSSKKLEPVQVHSIASKGTPTVKHERVQPSAAIVQSVNVTTLVDPTCTELKALDDLSSKADDANQDWSAQSPRKKRDFYGKLTDASTPASPTRQAPRQSSKGSSSTSKKTRPGPKPAGAKVPSSGTAALPDQSVSVPSLRTVS